MLMEVCLDKPLYWIVYIFVHIFVHVYEPNDCIFNTP